MKKWLSVLLALSLLVVLCGCKKAAPATNGNEASFEYDESRGYFLDDETVPQMAKEELKATLAEAYFTQNDHMYVRMKIGNGTEDVQRIDLVDVAIFYADKDELIAGGIVELTEELTVKAGEVIEYDFYISPEHVEVKDGALPETLSYSITIDNTPVKTK